MMMMHGAHLVWPSTITSLLPRLLMAYRMLPSACGLTTLPATLRTKESQSAC